MRNLCLCARCKLGSYVLRRCLIATFTYKYPYSYFGFKNKLKELLEQTHAIKKRGRAVTLSLFCLKMQKELHFHPFCA